MVGNVSIAGLTNNLYTWSCHFHTLERQTNNILGVRGGIADLFSLLSLQAGVDRVESAREEYLIRYGCERFDQRIDISSRGSVCIWALWLALGLSVATAGSMPARPVPTPIVGGVVLWF
jgi:hypothetical protein